MATQFNDLGFNQGLTTKMLVGNALITDLAKMKTLYGQTTSTGGAYYCTFRDYATGTAYQVPSGKKFIAVGLRFFNNATSSTCDVYLGTVTSDLGFASSSTTGAVYQQLDTFTSYTGMYTTPKEYALSHVFTVGFYIFGAGVPSTAGCYLTLYGFEVDADATTI